MTRILSALSLFLSGTLCGYYASSEIRKQNDLILAFNGSLQLFRAEIAYGALSLPTLFTKAAESLPEPLRGLFFDISCRISRDPGRALTEHVRSAFDDCTEVIPKPVRETLFYLSPSLGSADAAGQLHALTLCEERMRSVEQNSMKGLRDRCRTCRIAGFCAGAAAAILIL